MIKITYKQDAFDYKDIDKQPYDIKVKAKVIEDATAAEAIETFVKILEIATYDREVIKRGLQEVIENIDNI